MAEPPNPGGVPLQRGTCDPGAAPCGFQRAFCERGGGGGRALGAKHRGRPQQPGRGDFTKNLVVGGPPVRPRDGPARNRLGGRVQGGNRKNQMGADRGSNFGGSGGEADKGCGAGGKKRESTGIRKIRTGSGRGKQRIAKARGGGTKSRFLGERFWGQKKKGGGRFGARPHHGFEAGDRRGPGWEEKGARWA